MTRSRPGWLEPLNAGKAQMLWSWISLRAVMHEASGFAVGEDQHNILWFQVGVSKKRGSRYLLKIGTPTKIPNFGKLPFFVELPCVVPLLGSLVYLLKIVFEKARPPLPSGPYTYDHLKCKPYTCALSTLRYVSSAPPVMYFTVPDMAAEGVS